MKLKLFFNENCPKCPKAKNVAKQSESLLSVEYFNVETADGLAEAQFYTIMATPSLILTDDLTEKEIKSWRGETPDLKELTSFIKTRG